MKLLPQTLNQWYASCRREARELGYKVEFIPLSDSMTAFFFNGEYYCFTRTFGRKETD